MKDYSEIIGKLRQAFTCKDYPDGCRGCVGLGKCRTQIARKSAETIEELILLHRLDLSETVRLRRQIQALAEEMEAAHA